MQISFADMDTDLTRVVGNLRRQAEVHTATVVGQKEEIMQLKQRNISSLLDMNELREKLHDRDNELRAIKRESDSRLEHEHGKVRPVAMIELQKRLAERDTELLKMTHERDLLTERLKQQSNAVSGQKGTSSTAAETADSSERFSTIAKQLGSAEAEVADISRTPEHLEALVAAIISFADMDTDLTRVVQNLRRQAEVHTATIIGQAAEIMHCKHQRNLLAERLEEQSDADSAERANKIIATLNREVDTARRDTAEWKQKAEAFAASAHAASVGRGSESGHFQAATTAGGPPTPRPETDLFNAEVRGLHTQIESLKQANEALRQQLAASSNFQGEIDRLRRELLAMSSEMGIIKSRHTRDSASFEQCVEPIKPRQGAALGPSDALPSTNSFEQRVEESLSTSLNVLKAKQAHISGAEKAPRGTAKDLVHLERQAEQLETTASLRPGDRRPVAPLSITPPKKEKTGWLSMLGTGTEYYCTVNVNTNVLKFSTKDSMAEASGERRSFSWLMCYLLSPFRLTDAFVACLQRCRQPRQCIRHELHCRGRKLWIDSQG
jgi:predicted site-specific integrase-resolvase